MSASELLAGLLAALPPGTAAAVGAAAPVFRDVALELVDALGIGRAGLVGKAAGGTAAAAVPAAVSIGDVMPDYDIRVSLDADLLTIRGSVVDPELRAVCGISPAFPADFRTQIPLRGPLGGFRQQYADKVLELAVVKAEA